MRTIFKIDLDNKLIEEDGWEEKWIETRKSILKIMGFKLIDYIRKPSQYRDPRTKEMIKGRGFHQWFHCEGPEITEEEKVKIQWLLGDCSGRAWLNLVRVRRGVPLWNKIFSFVFYKKPPSKKCLECGLRRRIIELSGERKF